MIDEIWRDVKDYEGLYEVSNLGRVRSLNYKRTGEIRLLKVQKHSDGYLQVGLWKDGKHKNCKVHRLVAMAFIPNPDGLPQVNHIDENPANNFVWNLEWCTVKYNTNYGSRNERSRKKQVNNPTKSKRVYQYTLDGSFVRLYPSTNEVHRRTGYSQGRIAGCCRGEYKQGYGYRWSYDPPKPTHSRVLW